MIARMTLVLLLCWSSPASAMCGLRCASAETSLHSAVAVSAVAVSAVAVSAVAVTVVPQRARGHEHCEKHAAKDTPRPARHMGDEDCYCTSARLVAEPQPILDAPSSALLLPLLPNGLEPLADEGTARLLADDPPGPPLDAFAERNLPLLI